MSFPTIGDLASYAWDLLVLVLAIASLVQGYRAFRKKSAWSVATQPESRQMAIAVRCLGGVLLLFWLVWTKFIQWGWDYHLNVQRFAYEEARLLPITLYLIGMLCAIWPLKHYRLQFETPEFKSKAYSVIMIAAGIVLLFMVTLETMLLVMLVNAAVDGIVLAMGGPWVYDDGGPYILKEFAGALRQYHWSTQYQLIPIAALAFAYGSLALVLVAIRTHRGGVERIGMRNALNLVAVVALALVLQVALWATFWPRTNPFVLDALPRSFAFWVGCSVIVVLATAPIAWFFSFRRSDDSMTLAPVADPFAALHQPKLLLAGLCGCWVILFFFKGLNIDSTPTSLFHMAIFMSLVTQLVGDHLPQRSKLTAIKQFDRRVFLSNWLILAVTLPPIVMLLPPLPLVLLSI